MSLHKLTAGDGYTYLTRQVAAYDATDRGSNGLAEYYDEKGESPGRWWGSGLIGLEMAAGSLVDEAQMKHLFGAGRHPRADSITARLSLAGAGAGDVDRATRLGRPFARVAGATEFSVRLAKAYVEHNHSLGRAWSAAIPASHRARIRTALADEMFAEQYGRSPIDIRERHGFIAETSRERSTTVAGFDLTFTPVKSVSALWALADEEVAQAIAREHAAAVQDTLAWAEGNVLFTRRGHHGVRQVPTRGLIAAVFTHRDSRAGDPNLHTHVAVSNKVQDLEGRWLAVDARPLFKANVTLSEHYNTRLEARLRDALGLRFEADLDRPRETRVVREVAGVDKELITLWSSRRAVITSRLNALTTDFQAVHQRPPTPTEAIALAQQANLETREAKHSPRSEREQREQWRGDAIRLLRSERAVRDMVSSCLGAPLPIVKTGSIAWREEVALRVVSVLEGSRATWQEWHVRAEVERQVRYADVALEQHDALVDRLVHDVLAVHSLSIPDSDPLHGYPPPPPALQRNDGVSVYAQHKDRRFTSTRILKAERSLMDAALLLDGSAVPAARARAYFEQGQASRLSDEQRQLVTRLACSSQRLQVALAPAGTGKTTCMSALADLWRTGGGNVIGLAPSAAAAQQLSEALTPPVRDACALSGDPVGQPSTCETLTKFVQDISSAGALDPRVDNSTLVIIDEAAMAGTVELAAAVSHAITSGATIRLLGDDRQLTSVAAGGIVRDLADRYSAATLSTTHRFADPLEGEATLALRAGDPLALGYYADQDRWHVGDLNVCVDQAYDAWRTDIRHGLTSVLLAPTRDLVTSLNVRAQAQHRAQRAHPSTSPHSGPEVRLHDGTRVQAGDVVITRHNDRRLRLGPTRWIKNGDRWQVTAVHPDGHLTLRSVRDEAQVQVPATYVASHVELGYATTVHGAQGISVDTAHLVLAGSEDRSLLYVGLTRGRLRNSMYVGVLADVDPASGDWHHLATRPETLRPPTAVEVVRSILARETEQASATNLMDPTVTPASLQQQVTMAVDRFRDALYVAAEEVVGNPAASALDRVVADRYPELAESPTWETLRGQLLLAGCTTTASPSDLLESAVQAGDFHTVRDPAAVIAARLERATSPAVTAPSAGGPGGPLPWLPEIPSTLQEHAVWGAYLVRRAAWVTETCTALAQAADVDLLSDPPMWAHGLRLDGDPTLLGDLAVWRAAEAIADEDLAPTGARARPGRAGEQQALLQQRVMDALIEVESLTLPEEVLADPELPQLTARLDSLTRAGVELAALIEQTTEADAALPTELPAAALWWRLRRALDEAPPTPTPQPEPSIPTPVEMVDPGPDPRWSATGHTSRDRVVELHHLAADYYRDLLGRSWAQPYLAERLLLPASELPSVGYAPPGPTSLLRHLEALGATAGELIDAGLVKQVPGRNGRGGGQDRRQARLVDCFRDRLVFPIHDPRSLMDIVGFVGRRNPARDETEKSGPKYLNTRSTAAYAKSDSLFGLEQVHRYPNARLALVEGPLDALAVTRATSGAVIGVAVLGTTLTTDQARLTAHVVDDDRLVLTAFDGDDAGARASQSCLGTLRQVGVHGLSVHLPAGVDPSAALQQHGPTALATILAEADERVLTRAALSPDTASRSAGPRGAVRGRSRGR